LVPQFLFFDIKIPLDSSKFKAIKAGPLLKMEVGMNKIPETTNGLLQSQKQAKFIKQI
jgi:hypothetical protein